MKILVGYDGSRTAKDAVKLAELHATAFQATVHVVTSMVTGTKNQQDEINAAESGLKWAKEVLGNRDIACEKHLLIRGVTAGEDLVMFARDNKIDEIIIGVKRRSRVGKLLLGSTSQYVILNAHCPVVTIK